MVCASVVGAGGGGKGAGGRERRERGSVCTTFAGARDKIAGLIAVSGANAAERS